MTALTDAGEALALDALFPAATARHVALHTGDPGETGAANELAAANGYARESSVFTRTDSTADNDSALVFGPATAAQGTITHVSIWTAASGGSCLWKGALDASRVWPDGATFEIAAGDLTCTAD